MDLGVRGKVAVVSAFRPIRVMWIVSHDPSPAHMVHRGQRHGRARGDRKEWEERFAGVDGGSGGVGGGPRVAARRRRGRW